MSPVWPRSVYRSWVAVFITAALICSAVKSGCVWATRAAMPATCGEDIDVPERVDGALPVPDAADEISVPGAATSGLTTPSEPCTPREDPLLSRSPSAGLTTNPALASDGPRCTTRGASADAASISGSRMSVDAAVSCAPGTSG